MPIFFENEEFCYWPYNPKYFVSRTGKILSFYTQDPKLLIPAKKKTGYLVAVLLVDGKRCHRTVQSIVLQTFAGPRPVKDGRTYDAAHLNGNRTDNRLENLKWVTKQENLKHAFHHAVERDSTYLKSKLTPKNVLQIRSMLIGGGSKTAIADLFGVTISAITQIETRKTWRHLH